MKIYKPTYRDKVTGETRHTEHYYLRYRGKRYPLHVADKKAAEAKARDLMSTLALGYDPKRQEKARTEQIALLADEYYDALAATAGERQRSQVRQRIIRIADELGVKTLTELTVEKVQGWLNRLKRSARTRHHYRTSVRSFGVWLETTGRTARNPFVGLEKVRNIEADRRLVRRALSAAEFELLVVTTERSLRRFCKLSGRRRAMLYRLIAGTGLRRSEVASLLPSSFCLCDDVPHVVVEAAYTKNRKRAIQPLLPSLVPLLREYLRGLPERPVWPVAKGMTSLMVAGDLDEAGIPLVVDGRTYDFHSIRGQYATRLALAGVGLVASQRLLRHSTPALTSNIYTHLGLKDLGDAVAGL